MKQKIDVLKDRPPLHPLDALERYEAPITALPRPSSNANPVPIEKCPSKPQGTSGQLAPG